MAILDKEGRLFGKLSLVDALILCSLLSLVPGGLYAFRMLTTWDPLIDSVAPPIMNAEKGGVLIIYGKNFRKDSRVFLGDKALSKTTYLPPDRLEAIVPPQKEWGRRDISVANPTGQMAILKNSFGLVVKPRISRISPTRFKAREGGLIQILGENFDSSCSVTIGHPKMKDVEFVSPEQLLVRVAPREVAPGTHTISVTNVHGLSVFQPDVIDAEGCYVVTIFATVPFEEVEKLRVVWDGPDEWDGEEIRVLNILKKQLPPQTETKETKKTKTGKKANIETEKEEVTEKKETTVVANILLPGQKVKLVDTEWGRRYFFKESRLDFGSQLILKVKGVTIDAKVVSTPAPLYSYDPDASFRYD